METVLFLLDCDTEQYSYHKIAVEEREKDRTQRRILPFCKWNGMMNYEIHSHLINCSLEVNGFFASIALTRSAFLRYLNGKRRYK